MAKLVNIDVGYEDENPLGDWFIKITVPKQSEWKETERVAKEMATKIRKELEDA